MALWLVRSSPMQAVRVQALAQPWGTFLERPGNLPLHENRQPQKESLRKSSFRSSKRKFGMRLSCGESFRTCGKNEKLRKMFIEKLQKSTNFNFIFVILWQTRQIKSLFNNKDKNTHRSKVDYKGDCSCGVDYIGETVRNLAVRIAEHSNPAHTSEPAKHLRENPSHSFTWRVLSSAINIPQA